MGTKLNNFLNNYKTDDPSNITHVSLSGGKYNIPLKQKETLLNIIVYKFKS